MALASRDTIRTFMRPLVLVDVAESFLVIVFQALARFEATAEYDVRVRPLSGCKQRDARESDRRREIPYNSVLRWAGGAVVPMARLFYGLFVPIEEMPNCSA